MATIAATAVSTTTARSADLKSSSVVQRDDCDVVPVDESDLGAVTAQSQAGGPVSLDVEAHGAETLRADWHPCDTTGRVVVVIRGAERTKQALKLAI